MHNTPLAACLQGINKQDVLFVTYRMQGLMTTLDATGYKLAYITIHEDYSRPNRKGLATYVVFMLVTVETLVLLYIKI